MREKLTEATLTLPHHATSVGRNQSISPEFEAGCLAMPDGAKQSGKPSQKKQCKEHHNQHTKSTTISIQK